MDKIQILQTNLFARQKKKLKKNQVADLDKAIQELIAHPKIGQQKSGDLSEVWVYKFPILKQQYLLAYTWDEKSRTLIALGVHENFYRDIKRSVKF